MVLTPRWDPRKRFVGFLLITSDITKEVRLNRELARMRTYQSLLESTPDAMVVANSAGKIELANAETEKLFGYRREELVGQPVQLLIPARYHARHSEQEAGFFAKPRLRPMGVGLELTAIRSDGVEFRSRSASSAPDPGGAAGHGRDPRRHRA